MNKQTAIDFLKSKNMMPNGITKQADFFLGRLAQDLAGGQGWEIGDESPEEILVLTDSEQEAQRAELNVDLYINRYKIDRARFIDSNG